MNKNNIKISVIVPSYNSEKTIEKTIISIINQSYRNIELIIIDGGSSDETVAIIKKYQDKIKYWISEPDKGISDAFNKGLSVCSGDYINFQGADDFLLSKSVIEEMIQDIDVERDIFVCGKIKRIKEDTDNEVVFITSNQFKKTSLLFRMSLPHQALFTNKKFFIKYGNFDVNNKFCMDYEILLRAYKKFPSVIMKDVFVSAWREGGIGKDKTLEILSEYSNIKKKNKVAPNFIIELIYLWSIIKYHIKKIIRK